MASGRIRATVFALRAVMIALALAALAGPWIFDAGQQTVLTEFFTLLTLAMTWNLLAGYADIITVGQQGFVGVGAYAFFGLASLAHIHPYFAIPLAALITMLIAIPTMAIVFRLRTAYLAVGTWVAAEVMMLIGGKLPGFGGGSGTSLPIPIVKQFGASVTGRAESFYVLALALAALAFASIWLLLRSRVGLGLTAMRDNEEAAGSAGVNLTATRILCFLFTAPILGLVGVLTTLEKLRVAPSASFSITDWTIYVIFIVVIGGIGSLEGPFVGAAVFFLLRGFLADYGTWYLILLGAISIFVILVEPRGLWGLWRHIVRADLIPIGHAPSSIALAKSRR